MTPDTAQAEIKRPLADPEDKAEEEKSQRRIAELDARIQAERDKAKRIINAGVARSRHTGNAGRASSVQRVP